MYNSKAVIFPDGLFLNIDLLFYFGRIYGVPEGQFICMVDGITMRGAKSEKGLFISVDDAIDLCLRESQKKGTYANFRKELAVELNRWKDEYRRGKPEFRLSDQLIIALEIYLSSTRSSKWAPRALAIVRNNRQDLFSTKRKTLGEDNGRDSIVYFIQGETSKFIKIGHAGNAKNRLKGFQTGSSEELALLRSIPGGKALETELHQRFAHLRIRKRNEWFRPGKELLDYIEGLD